MLQIVKQNTYSVYGTRKYLESNNKCMADFDLHTILMINYIPSNVAYDT